MHPKLGIVSSFLFILAVLFSPIASFAEEYFGSPSSAAAPMTQPVVMANAPAVSAYGGTPPAAQPPEPKVTTIQEVNYLDLMFKDGYALPYHLKHWNFYNVAFDWGGSTLSLFRWNINDDKNATLADTTQRIQRWILYLYFNVRYGEHLRYYLKLRDRYHFEDFEPINNSNEGIDIDQMFGEITFDPLIFTMGRQFKKLGRGHVLRTNYDAFNLTYSDDFLDIDLFSGKLIGSNQDVFLPYNRQQKHVYGVDITYKEFKKHLFQGYVTGVKDTSDDGLTFRDSHYEPVYFGLYGVGRFDINKYRVRNLGYYGEMIRETGFSNNSDLGDPSTFFGHSRISAYLLDFGAILRLDHVWRPEIENEIMMGSGDNTVIPPFGRTESVRRGNPAGSKDSNFRDIDGFVNYGAALNPREANMIIYKLSFDARPMRRLTCGLDYFHYWKVKSAGVISDISAVGPGRNVGDEVDLRAQFDVNKYTRLDAVYGYFMPGDAYNNSGSNDAEQLLQFILSYVF